MEATNGPASEIHQAVERLVSAENDEARQASQEGTRDGRTWVLRWATPAELRRMESLANVGFLDDRIPTYESRGVSESEEAPFETIRQMVQDSPPDFGADGNFVYWDAFEDSAMEAYAEVAEAMAAERGL
jgi:hypothetical protein